MSNQTARKKLTLHRETIRTLDTIELDGVQGGVTPATPGILTASVRFCQHTGKILGGVVSAVKATKWAYEHRPKGNPNDPPSVVGATA
jgi:hypothetical protein